MGGQHIRPGAIIPAHFHCAVWRKLQRRRQQVRQAMSEGQKRGVCHGRVVLCGAQRVQHTQPRATVITTATTAAAATAYNSARLHRAVWREL